MIGFNGFTGVIGKKLPSDSTLCGMKKTELINFLHVAEHNYNVLVELYGSSGGRCQSDKWISVDDAMPAEKNSIFAKLKGTDKWNSVMWEKTSGEVIVCIEFEDGTRKTTVAKTHDGSWKLDMPILKQKVTHWMPLPELPKEER